VLIALAALGIALMVMPLAFRMFDRAPKGATMIAEFAPFMTNQRLDGYQREIRQIDAGVQQANTERRRRSRQRAPTREPPSPSDSPAWSSSGAAGARSTPT
jgi:hypothetical protein